MTIEKIRNNITSCIGKEYLFKVNGARNQTEKFYGVITSTYKFVFLIKCSNGIVKSFSYSDVLIGNIELISIS
jgi:uncharacterized protein Veg